MQFEHNIAKVSAHRYQTVAITFILLGASSVCVHESIDVDFIEGDTLLRCSFDNSFELMVKP